jgi:hypothetical protein
MCIFFKILGAVLVACLVYAAIMALMHKYEKHIERDVRDYEDDEEP